MTSRNLSVNSVDFDTIKSNLKTFLSNTDTFKDYDFEGSGLSVLLDALAYTTYYQGVYNNFVANEMFLDTAKQRSSIVSHAKSLGYPPSSYTAPTATVDLNLGSTLGFDSTFPAGSVFRTTISGKQYRFVNLESASLSLTADGATVPHVSNLTIKEGSIRNKTLLVPNNDPYQKLLIDDEFVDTSTIKVTVQNSVSDRGGITNEWTLANDPVSITAGSNAYWIETEADGKYSVNFGDGVLGVTLATGNLVNVSYLSTNGPLANGVGRFDDLTGQNSFAYGTGNTVDVVSFASGGSIRQNAESIRRLAPKSYSMQNRAVTVSDFQTLIESNFSGFSSVFVYGGEDATPPQFGSVIISFKPNTNTTVTSEFKNSVVNFLKDRCPVTITPVVVDPTLTYLRFDTSVVYDPTQTALNRNAVKSFVQRNLSSYVLENTDDYDTLFSTSLLTKNTIDGEPSIVSLSTKVNMEVFVTPINVSTDYTVKYPISIFHPHDGHQSVISSETFRYLDGENFVNARIKDDGSGKIILFNADTPTTTIIEDFGVVDYAEGEIKLNLARLAAMENRSNFGIRAVLNGNIIKSSQDNVIVFNSGDPTANLVSVETIDETGGRQITASTASSSSTPTTNTSSTSSSSGGGGGGGAGGGGYGGY